MFCPDSNNFSSLFQNLDKTYVKLQIFISQTQILISQTTDSHFANYRFSFRFVPFRFVSFRFAPFRFANYSISLSDQLKNAYAKTSALRKIRRFLPHDAMIKLYKAFILPHLEYSLFVGIGTGQRNLLEDGNCYILRTLIGHNKSTDELLTTAIAWLPWLYCRRLHQALASSQVRLSSDANDFKSKLHDCSFLEPDLWCTNDCSFLLFLERVLQFSSHVFSIWLFSRF